MGNMKGGKLERKTGKFSNSPVFNRMRTRRPGHPSAGGIMDDLADDTVPPKIRIPPLSSAELPNRAGNDRQVDKECHAGDRIYEVEEYRDPECRVTEHRKERGRVAEPDPVVREGVQAD
jgi:hypothetical protein